MAEAAGQAAYVLKRINFFNRSVAIVLQNVNGPCPLLAIANVLSLRNQLQLPRDGRDISQERLVTMIADLLLEASKQYERAAGGAAAAHVAHAVSECFEVLSKLTTGIDVNVKFHSVHAFEPTREVAVFDLLGINLVHGWIVDPQDAATAAVFGNRSYNELVELIAVALGGGGGPGGSSHAIAAPVAREQQQQQDGAAASSSEQRGPGEAAEAAASGAAAPLAPAAAAKEGGTDEETIEAVISDLVSGVCQDLQLSEGSSGTKQQQPQDQQQHPQQESSTDKQQQQESTDKQQQQESTDKQQQQQQQQAPPVARAPSASLAARDAAVAREFFDAHCSQLTPAGVAALAADLREHQLAVFFRNNHFSTAFKHEGRVYLLVTDQGYASEPDIVWERLDAVDGNTTLCTAAFQEFVPHAEPPYDPAAFEPASAAAAAAAAGGHEDADFALALQLQLAEEEAVAERARAARERQQQQAAAAAAQGGGQGQQLLPHQQAAARQQQYHQQQRQQQQQQGRGGGRSSAPQRRWSGGGGGASSGTAALEERLRVGRAKVEEKCSIM